MEHLGTVRIETDRLILRRFTEEDIEHSFNNWTSDAEITEFLRWPTHECVETTRNVFTEWIASYEKDDFYQWAIELKSLGQVIGAISVVGQREALDIVHIGYCIGSRWWKQGITSEAFTGIIPFLFEKVGVNRIESQHDPNNPNSGKVMVKCGLKYEGTLRQADVSNKGIVDACMYSLLRSEYKIRNEIGHGDREGTI